VTVSVRILLIDDDPEILDLVGSFLEMKGFEVDPAESGREGLDLYEQYGHNLVICDYRLPDLDGLDVSQQILEGNPDCVIILITGHGSIENAVTAIKAGVFDYILKPFDLKQIEVAIHKAQKAMELRMENKRLRQAISHSEEEDQIIGKSRPILELKKLIRRISPTRSTVLITGESGTGKELVAKAIHVVSARKDSPFVPINVGAIPDTLLEDELFGHVKGAFTDAVTDRVGKFEQASGGTLFLDEIGNMSLPLQAKLLRVLQEREVTPLGSGESRQVDVRVIAATNVDLKEEIAAGRFREDLYYRLNVIPVHIPPLRERKEDIVELIEFFNQRFSALMGFPHIRFDTQAMRAIYDYGWLGNVRQLENFVERMIVLQPENGLVKLENLPGEIRYHHEGASGGELGEGVDLKARVEAIERDYIMKALDASGGVKSVAARRLGLKRTTLIQKMKKLGIENNPA